MRWQPNQLACYAWAACVGILGACSKQEETIQPAKPVHVVVVKYDGAAATASYTGDVQARFESALGFRIPGKVVERSVDVGAQVKKGQKLARLDAADMRLSAEAAGSQLQAARSDFNQAKADLERFRELHNKSFISAAEFERRQTAFDVARARYGQAQAQLGVSRNQAGYTTLEADNDGVITAISAEVGQVVAAGQQVMRLARSGDKEVEIPVPESRLQELRDANSVRVKLWADPKVEYAGAIREVSPSADRVTRTYAVKVSILEADAKIQLGMTANVFLKTEAPNKTVILPSTAVFQQGATSSVWVLDEQSQQIHAKPVQVSEYRQDAVVILSGLKDGERVVRAGVHKLFEGEKVRVIAEPAS